MMEATDDKQGNIDMAAGPSTHHDMTDNEIASFRFVYSANKNQKEICDYSGRRLNPAHTGPRKLGFSPVPARIFADLVSGIRWPTAISASLTPSISSPIG